MASSSIEHDVMTGYEKLSINEDEQEGLILEDVPVDSSNGGYDQCLVGNFISN